MNMIPFDEPVQDWLTGSRWQAVQAMSHRVQSSCGTVVVTLPRPLTNTGRLRLTRSCVFIAIECVLMCDVSDGWGTQMASH